MDIDMDHDTTSILLQWAIYELSRTPHALAAIKTELDKLLGSDTSPTTTKETLLKKRRNPPPANVLHCRRHQRNTPSLPALGNSAVYSPREWIHHPDTERGMGVGMSFSMVWPCTIVKVESSGMREYMVFREMSLDLSGG